MLSAQVDPPTAQQILTSTRSQEIHRTHVTSDLAPAAESAHYDHSGRSGQIKKIRP
jgi:hypothetical protein